MSPNSTERVPAPVAFANPKSKFWDTPSPTLPADDASDSSTVSVSPPHSDPVPNMGRPGTPASALPSAISAVAALKQTGISPLFFLDYDGTLAPIVDDPEKAFLPEDTRVTLKELASSVPVAIVSGRARSKVERFVGLPAGPPAAAAGDVAKETQATTTTNTKRKPKSTVQQASRGCLYYAGSHGFDIGGSSGGVCRHMTVAEGYLSTLREARARIERLLGIDEDGFGTGIFAGASVEDNWLAFSLHFRRCSDRNRVAPLIESVVDEVLEQLPTLKKTFGKCVFEVRPRIDWDKGRAVEWLMEALQKEDGLEETAFTPIYIGDDKTDEDAFRVLKGGRGVSILVQDPEVDPHVITEAQYILKSPAEVQQFLAQFV